MQDYKKERVPMPGKLMEQQKAKKKEKFTLFSEHKGSLLRRQPGAEEGNKRQRLMYHTPYKQKQIIRETAGCTTALQYDSMAIHAVPGKAT